MRLLISLCLVAVLSGCALVKDEVTLGYTPGQPVELVPGASESKVAVRVKDSRNVQDRISVKKNGYGMEMAAIVATNSVPDLVKSALEIELRARGFQIAPGGADLAVELVKVYNDFKLGFFSGEGAGEVQFTAVAQGPDHKPAAIKIVNASGRAPDVFLMGGENAKLAVESALHNAIAIVMADQEFLNALRDTALKAAGVQPAS